MSKKLPTILSLGAAIAALQGFTALDSTPAAANSKGIDEANAPQNRSRQSEPNVFMSLANDVLGIIVTEKADGPVVAEHSSHYSHSSHSPHSSHHSHYSSRY